MWTDTPHTRLFSRHIWPCAHITLWLKVWHDVSCMKHVHPHVITCLSVCCCLVLSSSSVSRASTFSHCLRVLCPAHLLPCGRNRRGIKPMRTRRMRSIAPWRYTTLSQVMSPTSSTISATQRLLQRSSGWIRRHRHWTVVLVRCGTRRWDHQEKRYLHHCFIQEREEPANLRTSLSLSWRKFVTSSVLFRTHKDGETRIRTWKTKRANSRWSQNWDPEARIPSRSW